MELVETFGIELEFFTVEDFNYDQICTILSLSSGIPVVNLTAQHKSLDYSTWKIDTDASIEPDNPEDRFLSFELISPVLSFARDTTDFFSSHSFGQIASLFDTLQTIIGARCNKTTGFHVHYGIDHKYLNLERFQLLCFQLVKHEEIFQRMVPPHRRNTNYLKMVTKNIHFAGRSLQDIKTMIRNTETIEQLVQLMNPGNFDRESMQQARYHWINITNLMLRTIDTIEFRIFPGTQ